MTGMFTGCGSSQQAAGSSGAEAGQTQTGDNSLFNEPGQLPIVNEPVTLTVFAPANPDGSWEDNEMVKELILNAYNRKPFQVNKVTKKR